MVTDDINATKARAAISLFTEFSICLRHLHGADF
jgi:hypothetical protein